MTVVKHSPSVVLKLGGTSVSSAVNWQNIASVSCTHRLADGLRPVIVHSALSGVTDLPGDIADGSDDGRAGSGPGADRATSPGSCRAPRRRPRRRFRTSVRGIEADRFRYRAGGRGERSLRGRVCWRMGELMAPRAWRGVPGHARLAGHVGGRRAPLLRADLRRSASARSSILSATCSFEPDPQLQQRFATTGQVVITQGFIASDNEGNTVLLGRGGSDIVGRLLCSKAAGAATSKSGPTFPECSAPIRVQSLRLGC